MHTPIRTRLSYILRSLTSEGRRNIFKGFAPWRRRVERRKSWLLTTDMEPRIQDVLSCPDLESIARVPKAGSIENGILTMHNGLKVLAGSYSGDPMTKLLQRTQGIHEPQEEKVFSQVLKHLAPQSSMLELGAWWGFYSMWFQKELPKSQIYLIEPVQENLEFGKKNLALNGMQATFHHAFVNSESNDPPAGVPSITIDDALKLFQIRHLSILHCDIQGYEFAMLQGARNSLKSRAIDYFFISTHTTNLHYACLDSLRQADYEILAQADMLDTYSFDGLIAARRRELQGCTPVTIALR